MALGGKHSLPGFERSLEELRADILLMASLVRRSLGNVKKGFVQRDEDDCSAVIADDEEVDLLEKQVDRSGTNILIRFQPLASDFRTVLATIKLASHLEHISDQAVIIARRTRTLIQDGALVDDEGLTPVFEQVDASFAEALEAFAGFDNTRAENLHRQAEPLAQEARGAGFERASPNSSRRTLMSVTIGLWFAAAGVVAVSLESFGAAFVLIGIAGLLIRLP